MFSTLTITNQVNEKLKLNLTKPGNTGFIVLPITGLTPVKASISSSDITTGDGSRFNSARIPDRNIVLQFVFVETPLLTIDDVRQKSYKYFPIKKKIKMEFKLEDKTIYIYGIVESNEAEIFSQLPGTQISVICNNPYFMDKVSNVTLFSGVEPMFEFPFSNESLTENMITFGEIQNKTQNVVTNTGDTDTGVLINIHATDDVENVSIYNLTNSELIKIDTDVLENITGQKIIKGDDIIINTNQGEKQATLIRDGVETNILNCLGRSIDWFTLNIGDNIFAFTAELGTSNLQFTITNDILYSGV